jgi:hypothetical protein
MMTKLNLDGELSSTSRNKVVVTASAFAKKVHEEQEKSLSDRRYHEISNYQ